MAPPMHPFNELSTWIGIIFLLIIPAVGWALAYLLLLKLRGKKILIILTVTAAVVIQIISPCYEFFYLESLSESQNQWPYLVGVIVLFFFMSVIFLIKPIGIAWLNDDQKIREWLELTDGSYQYFLCSRLVKLFAFCLLSAQYLFWVGVAVLFLSILIFDTTYSYGIGILAIIGGYVCFHLFILRYFPFINCKHCHRFLVELDKKNNYVEHLKKVVFKEKFDCMYCGAHYFFSKEALDKTKEEARNSVHAGGSVVSDKKTSETQTKKGL